MRVCVNRERERERETSSKEIKQKDRVKNKEKEMIRSLSPRPGRPVGGRLLSAPVNIFTTMSKIFRFRTDIFNLPRATDVR